MIHERLDQLSLVNRLVKTVKTTFSYRDFQSLGLANPEIGSRDAASPVWLPDFLFVCSVVFQHLPSALASFSGFLMNLSTSRSILQPMAFTADGIAPPGIPLLGCSPPPTVFGGVKLLTTINKTDIGCLPIL